MSRWPMVPFSRALTDATGGQTKIQKRDYLSTGLLPVIDQGQAIIGGYTNEIEAQANVSLPVILFGDHTRAFKFVTSPFAIGADGVKVLVPCEGFDAEYLYHFLQSFDLPSHGYSRHFKFLKEISIPLPPLADQRRIVDLLNHAAGIRRLRQQALKTARALIPALFVKMFGDPARNEKGWEMRPLEGLVSFVSGGTPSKSREDLWLGDLPWVSPKDMKRVEISNAIDHVNKSVLTETSLKLIPAGSLLIVVRGMILVHTVPVAITLVPVTINQDMKALVLGPGIDEHYLLWSLRVRHPHLLAKVETAAHGTKKLETERLKNLEIPVPPLALQQIFATRVADLNALITQQERHLAQAEALLQSLMARFFGGSLECGDTSPLYQSADMSAHSKEPIESAVVPAHSKTTTPRRRFDSADIFAPSQIAAEALAAYTAGGQAALPAANQPVPARILAAMALDRDYSRAELLAATGISAADWTGAIRQLKEEGKVRQTGEKRGARYQLAKKGGRR